MSNWKACIPANPKYERAKNMFWVTNVSIEPHEGASIKVQVHYQNGALANEFITITGDEYKEWGADDNWIYQKVARKLCLGVLADSVDASGNPVQYVPSPAPAPAPVTEDIARIQTMQEQLNEQQKKIEQITTLLFKNGSL